MRFRRRIHIALVTLSVLGAFALLAARLRCVGFPGEHWDHITPERAGFDPALLADFVVEVGGNGLVVRYGSVVTWWGDYARPLDVASACKPVYAHLVYAALKDGLIGDLDEKVSIHMPDLGAHANVHDREITWRHLLQQTACYGVEEDPGMAFNYSDYQAALLADAIVFKVYQTGYSQVDRDVLQKYLAGSLGFQDQATLNQGWAPAGRLYISARDFARFGLLYLNKGSWRGRQCIPRELAIQAVTSPLPYDFPRTDQVAVQMLKHQRSIGARGANLESHMGSYSYTWWVNGVITNGLRAFPHLPADTFLAQGHSGHNLLLVIPSLELVVCWLDALPGWGHARRFSTEGYALVNAATHKLMAAMIRE
jgi:CubicO group peptidase (beta-lactamase class C family)